MLQMGFYSDPYARRSVADLGLLSHKWGSRGGNRLLHSCRDSSSILKPFTYTFFFNFASLALEHKDGNASNSLSLSINLTNCGSKQDDSINYWQGCLFGVDIHGFQRMDLNVVVPLAALAGQTFPWTKMRGYLKKQLMHYMAISVNIHGPQRMNPRFEFGKYQNKYENLMGRLPLNLLNKTFWWPDLFLWPSNCLCKNDLHYLHVFVVSTQWIVQMGMAHTYRYIYLLNHT